MQHTMAPIFIVSDNIISPLGLNTAENFQQLKKGRSGVQMQDDISISPSFLCIPA